MGGCGEGRQCSRCFSGDPKPLPRASAAFGALPGVDSAVADGFDLRPGHEGCFLAFAQIAKGWGGELGAWEPWMLMWGRRGVLSEGLEKHRVSSRRRQPVLRTEGAIPRTAPMACIVGSGGNLGRAGTQKEKRVFVRELPRSHKE